MIFTINGHRGVGLMGVILALVVFSGCLTVQEKEYRFTLNSDGSGEGVITYIDLVSEEDEGKNVSFKDFGELISDYYEGTTFEDENPNYTVTEKKLYEKDDMLMGEVHFTFSSLDSIGFYTDRSCNCSGIMYYMGSLSETLLETNGKYLGENQDFPMIVWKAGTKEFSFKTQVKEDMSDAHSLLPLYNTWKNQ